MSRCRRGVRAWGAGAPRGWSNVPMPALVVVGLLGPLAGAPVAAPNDSDAMAAVEVFALADVTGAAHAVAPFPGGGLVLAGGTQRLDRSGAGVRAVPEDGFVARLDGLTGAPLYVRTIDFGGRDSLADVALDRDGHAVAVGSSARESGARWAWIVKLTPDGREAWRLNASPPGHAFTALEAVIQDGPRVVAVGATRAPHGFVSPFLVVADGHGQVIASRHFQQGFAGHSWFDVAPGRGRDAWFVAGAVGAQGGSVAEVTIENATWRRDRANGDWLSIARWHGTLVTTGYDQTSSRVVVNTTAWTLDGEPAWSRVFDGDGVFPVALAESVTVDRERVIATGFNGTLAPREVEPAQPRLDLNAGGRVVNLQYDRKSGALESRREHGDALNGYYPWGNALDDAGRLLVAGQRSDALGTTVTPVVLRFPLP